MAKSLAKSWYDEAFEKAEKRGFKVGEKRGELNASRKLLRMLLEYRFGALPKTWVRRIDSAKDASKLSAAMLKVRQIESLDELEI